MNFGRTLQSPIRGLFRDKRRDLVGDYNFLSRFSLSTPTYIQQMSEKIAGQEIETGETVEAVEEQKQQELGMESISELETALKTIKEQRKENFETCLKSLK